MDFDLMITSFPKLLDATVVTLKLLFASLFFGLFLGLFFAILRLNKNILEYPMSINSLNSLFSILPKLKTLNLIFAAYSVDL